MARRQRQAQGRRRAAHQRDGRLPRRPGVDRRGQAVAGHPGRRRLGGHPLAGRLRRPRRQRPRVHRAVRGAGPLRRARHAVRHRRRHDRADDHRPRHRRAEGPLPPADAPRRGDLVPALERARRRLRPRRRSAPGPSATATSSCSTARRCGPAAPTTATSASGIFRTDPTRAEAQGHLLLHRRPARRRASRSARCARSPARPTSTRCSSTTCASPPPTSSATCTTAGASPAPR